MELRLTFGPTWSIDPGRAICGDVVVTYGPITLDLGIERELPDGSRVVVRREIVHATRDGWPLQLYDADVVGATTEARLYACYTFLAHVAVAIVRAPSAAAIEARRTELVAIFEAGRPDWRRDPICIADAWDMKVDASIGGKAHEHYARGNALAHRGEHAAATAEWERAIELSPDFVDAHYALGKTRYRLGDFAGALASFQHIALGDVLVQANVIQCLHALGRDDQALAAREWFRASWSRSREPRMRHLTEVLIDQFASGGFYVRVFETLPTWRLTFSADHASVVVERVEDGFTLSVVADGPLRPFATHATLPAYSQLKAEIVPLLVAAMAV